MEWTLVYPMLWKLRRIRSILLWKVLELILKV
jgi:hypothetical protein